MWGRRIAAGYARQLASDTCLHMTDTDHISSFTPVNILIEFNL